MAEMAFLPDERAFQSVCEQVRNTGRSYPLFSLAKMFLERPERYRIRFLAKPAAEGRPGTVFHQCGICGCVVTSASLLTQHLLKTHADKFYKVERIQGEAPKGQFATVARCKLNGALLGPTNHHAYQDNLMRLYKQRYSNMPFERFKASVVIEKDPELVKKWQEAAAWKTTYTPLQGEQPKAIENEMELERHCRENHLPSSGTASADCVASAEVLGQGNDPAITRLWRSVIEEETRFPINVAQCLREHFFKAGLNVFKGRKGMQFVAAVRPKPFVADRNTVTTTVWAILEYIQKHPLSDRKKVLAAISPAETETAAEAPKQEAAADKTVVPAAEPAQVSAEQPAAETPAAAKDAVPEGTAPKAVVSPAAQDLYWLVRQGYVIEYHNGQLQCPPPPKKKDPKKEPKRELKEKAEGGKQPAIEPDAAKNEPAPVEQPSVPAAADEEVAAPPGHHQEG